LLRRFGGDMSSNTLAASMVRVGREVQPVINLMRDVLLDADLIYGDETTFQVLKEPGRRPQTKSYLWAQMSGAGPPVRLFTYAPGRGGKHADHLYAGIRSGAVLMTDGYELYNGIAHANQLVHLGCWSHYLESRFILSRWPATLIGRSVASFTAVRSGEQTPDNSCRRLDGGRRVRGPRCRSPCGRSRVSRHTSRAVSGATPVCLYVPCILQVAVLSRVTAATRA